MANDKYLSDAVKMAQASIYDGARYLGEWRGFRVYEPTFADDEPRFIGFPEFVLAKDDVLRWDDGEEESRALMRYFYHRRK